MAKHYSKRWKARQKRENEAQFRAEMQDRAKDFIATYGREALEEAIDSGHDFF